MGQKDDAHAAAVNRDLAAGSEHQRLAGIHAGYRSDPRRRRSWSVANRGNQEMRNEVADHVLDHLPAVLRAGGLLLDAGCGTGWWLERLVDAGTPASRLVGVELLEERCAMARRRAPATRVLRADLRNLPLADDACSLATLFTVLSAMPNRGARRSALLEVRRVLAPGGLFVAWEPRVPTINRHTQLVRLSEVRAVFGELLGVRSVTVAPPLARRCGGSYRALARLAPLRTHRLIFARA